MSDEEEDAFAAFGSESEESEDELVVGGSDDANIVDSATSDLMSRTADAATLHITTSFLSRRKTTSLSNRYVALVADTKGTGGNNSGVFDVHLSSAISERLNARGVKILTTANESESDGTTVCDAAILFHEVNCNGEQDNEGRSNNHVNTRREKNEKDVRRGVVPGGFMLLTLMNNTAAPTGNNGKNTVKKVLELWRGRSLGEGVWDIEHADVIYRRSVGIRPDKCFEVTVVSITKRPCTTNTNSCPWKDLNSLVPSDLAHFNGETWLMHERSIIADATVARTASEVLAHQETKSSQALSEESIRAAVHALQTYGFVVLKDVFDPETQTLPWGDAILSDFEAAANILKERDNVDIVNPGQDGMSDPLNYREMAMREDLRVDLRDGPAIQKSRAEENKEAYKELGLQIDAEEDKGPTIVASAEGICDGSIRFHPSILRIIGALFNPHAEEDRNASDGKTKLYSGNFGRWNFGGAGPDGTPQPLRIGQIGSVISLPGSADQAIHADTPHLFEHIDCLPCHYANLFTPGAVLEGRYDEDGSFAGDMDSGGTAFVYGSHKLRETAKMTAEQPQPGAEKDSTVFSAASSVANEWAMHVRIVRPSLQVGDALIFDCRVLHFGLANRSKVDDTAPLTPLQKHMPASKRRPMLYVNMTHSWFHDPKNWDMRKGIFSS